ncbi:Uncharacterized protein Adt_38396 [Abeliophyllum distichum]|uniref:Uncharacterized protein n=1 Tax=Abeliophyllum distichum TaxID=126358 RepID=A0ABD1Q2B2_9LAMI
MRITLAILFLASLLITGNFQARAKMLPRKNIHRLLSDVNLGAKANVGTDGKYVAVKEGTAANEIKTAENIEAESGSNNEVNENHNNDDGASGSESHRLFPEEGKPNYSPPRHV